MEVTLTGSLSWVFNFCVLATSITIILLGTWIILNHLIWDILIKRALSFLNLYKLFVHFLMYRERYYKWAKKYENTLEEGAND